MLKGHSHSSGKACDGTLSVRPTELSRGVCSLHPCLLRGHRAQALGRQERSRARRFGLQRPGAQWGPWGLPPAFPSPNPKGTAILTHHPNCQSDHHPRQRPPSGCTSPFAPLLCSGAVGSASPAGASQWQAGEQRVSGPPRRRGSLPIMVTPAWHPSTWGKLALGKGSSRRQFLQLFTEDLPGPRSCVPHRPSNRGSILQSNN